MPAARSDLMTPGSTSSLVCSELSLDQELAGTAPTAIAWVIVEYSGPWSRDAFSAETFSGDPLGSELLRATGALESLGAKVLLARESGATHAPLHRDSRAWIAQAPDFAPRLGTVGELIDRVGASNGHSLDDLLDKAAGSDARGPHLFVCSHGKRDQCCAVKGRALVRDLKSTITHVWECSHLGGHRFAPTALLLPHAGVFGRLSYPSFNSILDGSSLGLEQLRGLTSLSSDQQVVDVAAKKLWRLPWFTHLSIDSIEADSETSTFLAKAPDERRIRCTVRQTIERLPVSCGKPASETKVWKVEDLRED